MSNSANNVSSDRGSLHSIVRGTVQGTVQHGFRLGRVAWAIAGSVGLLMASCGRGSAPEAANPDPAADLVAESPIAEGSADTTPTATPSEMFASPTVPVAPSAAATKPLPPGELATGLISSTTVPSRLPQVSAGRSDPFASLGETPVVIRQPAIPPVPPEDRPIVAELPQPQVLPELPALVPVPAVPPAIAVAAAPPAVLPVPAAPPVSIPQSIQISGAMEMGGRYSIIVEVPGEGSRYASVGDRLAGGTVLIKRVEMNGQEPRVILEHNGQEIVRTVGDRTALLSYR
ncbi:hypothetical protein HNI00_16645 [Thermoleptolyngbya oregonensis NK1-22]|uniref:Type II secretion system protein GspC N-terminal domain-containing protein n=1 Tax=Thermoleptolyngbya oregonensis NK1-22 TaxID=2547457 RepID=A0AA97BMN6_9CYAN|nr:hypothetical protein [Thermoleptolyngbya oregonensis]WOB44592.1 hypothetical protein HNI00_16645 [Thermoleptolyngbya oregonensis NK1-22]